MLHIPNSAHGVLFATGELVYVQGMGSRGRRAAPFDVAQGREPFDFAQDRELVERLVERHVERKLDFLRCHHK